MTFNQTLQGERRVVALTIVASVACRTMADVTSELLAPVEELHETAY